MRENHWIVTITEYVIKREFESHLCRGGRFGTKIETKSSASASISLL